ncbi:MAG: hypothetical protein ACJAV7_002809, partial [Flavobacteriales bacterium]
MGEGLLQANKNTKPNGRMYLKAFTVPKNSQ